MEFFLVQRPPGGEKMTRQTRWQHMYGKTVITEKCGCSTASLKRKFENQNFAETAFLFIDLLSLFLLFAKHGTPPTKKPLDEI